MPVCYLDIVALRCVMGCIQLREVTKPTESLFPIVSGDMHFSILRECVSVRVTKQQLLVMTSSHH